MLERQQIAVIVRAVETWKDMAARPIGARGGCPLVSIFVVGGADRLAQIAKIEPSGNRFVFLVRRGNVLVIGKRALAAVIRAAQGVLECPRLFVDQILMVA